MPQCILCGAQDNVRAFVPCRVVKICSNNEKCQTTMVRLERYFAGANGDVSSSSSSDVEWQDLPTEIWLKIATFFYNDPKTLVAMAGTNKRLRGIILNDSLWQGLNPETAVRLTEEEKQRYPEDQHLAIRTLKTWHRWITAYHARTEPDDVVRRVMLFTGIARDGHVNLFHLALSKYENDQSTNIDYVVLGVLLSFRVAPGFAMLRPQMWKTLARVMQKRRLLNRILEVTRNSLLTESIRRDDVYTFDIYFYGLEEAITNALLTAVTDERFEIFKYLVSRYGTVAIALVEDVTLPISFQEWFADDERVTFSRLVFALHSGEIDEAERIWTTNPITRIIQSLFDENFDSFSFKLFDSLDNWEDEQITIKTASFFLRHVDESEVLDQGLRRWFTSLPEQEDDFWWLSTHIIMGIDKRNDEIYGGLFDVTNSILPLAWRYLPTHVRASLSQFITWQQMFVSEGVASRAVPNPSAIRFIMSQGIQVPLMSFGSQSMEDMLRIAIEINDVASLDILTRIETGPQTTIRHPYLDELSKRPDKLGQLLQRVHQKVEDVTTILPALRWIFEHTTT